MKVFKRIIAGQIRHILGASGAGFYVFLLENGVEPSDIEAIISGVVAVVMAGWSAYEKYKTSKEEPKK